jgi:L-cysteine S-thiosulfotransferase
MKTSLCGVVGLVVGLVVPAAGQAPPQPALGAAIVGAAIPGAALAPFSVVVNNGIPTIPLRLSGKPGDPKNGERVVLERHLGNCLSCHEISALRREEFHGEIGPSLDGVARRWDAATLRMIVVNAKKVFGQETAMPAFYRVDGLNRVRPEFVGKPILTAQQVEDVVAYLGTMK